MSYICTFCNKVYKAYISLWNYNHKYNNKHYDKHDKHYDKHDKHYDKHDNI